MKVARGTSVTFEAEFVDMDGEGLVRADPSSTPQVQIKAPDDSILKIGLGKPVSTTTYVFEWFCPKDSVLNTPEKKYRADWFFIAQGGFTKSHTEEFDVIDRVEPSVEEKQQTYLSLMDKSERIFFRTEQDPFLAQGNLELEIRGNANELIKRVTAVSTDESKLDKNDPNRAIGKMEKDGEYVFYYDTDPLREGEYLIFWGLRKTAVSAMNYEQQVIRVPHWTFWRLNKSLRYIIDKLQKRIGWVQSYSDDAILEYIMRGLGTVNGIMPNTNWGLSSIPTVMNAASGVADAILLAATMHALSAQQILEIELSFDHSGQTVTLSYNHDYSGVLGNIQTMFDKFVEAKPRLYRVACGPGVVGVRVQRNKTYNQRVFKLHSDFSDSDWYNPTSLIASVFS